MPHRLSQFFKEQRSVLPAILPLFSSQQDVPFSVLEKKLELRELQMTYIFTTAIMKRYRVRFLNCMPIPQGNGTFAELSLPQTMQDIYTAKFELSTPSNPSNDSNFRMGWVLFIMCKAVFLPVHADLVSCFHLLVAVLNFLVVHMPACNLRLKMDDPKDMPHKTSDGRVDTVQSLAANTNALASEVTWMVHRMDQLLVPILKASLLCLLWPVGFHSLTMSRVMQRTREYASLSTDGILFHVDPLAKSWEQS